MQFKDYYAVLGVEASAGEAEIKTAYRRLARKYHPDVSKEAGAEDKFKAVNEAYEALRDPERRKAYDQLRGRGYRPGDEIHPPPGGFRGNGGGPDFDHEEVFGGGNNGGFSDFFESLFRRQAQQQQRGGPGFGNPPRGDTRARLAVPVETVYRGGAMRIAVNGRTLEVKVPRGIRPGQVIRLAGQGGQGGNLLLEVEYATHPRFEVDGRNIVYALQVAPWEAALGAAVSVPTLGGTVELKVPAGSEAGRRLRLRGRGLPGTGGQADGDQIVELEVQAPVPQGEAQQAAYEALREAFSGEWKRE
ncbi:DnaJ C-terminal domain-containing protein [Luteimonas changyuni]|uniref:DnaJ C-terminal domain-containing protein n=1 Tax=Luteimonas sp. MJ145 TaxID=3129234 RepID=UPI0031BAFCFB